MITLNNKLTCTLFMTTSLVLSGCGNSGNGDVAAANASLLNTGNTLDSNISAASKSFSLKQGTDLNSKTSALLSLNPGGPGGSPNQSLRGGDVIVGAPLQDDILIGGLGVDVLVGDSGDDILIGGTEDFNSNVDGDGDGDNKGSDNRDRAFGNAGNDVFIWAPGDGNDFFDGGDGTDVLIMGVLGEKKDSNGLTAGAPFFNVNPPGPDKIGSQDFDGIYLNDQNQPTVRVSASPGFCSLVDAAAYKTELDLLGLNQIVRFSLRSIANDFNAGVKTTDDGLRVAISTKNVEYLVCTKRTIVEGAGVDNIEVLNLTTTPPTVALLSDLPEYIAKLIQ